MCLNVLCNVWILRENESLIFKISSSFQFQSTRKVKVLFGFQDSYTCLCVEFSSSFILIFHTYSSIHFHILFSAGVLLAHIRGKMLKISTINARQVMVYLIFVNQPLGFRKTQLITQKDSCFLIWCNYVRFSWNSGPILGRISILG